jgi:2-oxo-4-hydroxy-4-carboxy--5-ureidoimidazoline (OHCU) decarboxylase
MSTLPPATTLNHLPTDHLTRLLDLLFEPSPPLHALALPLLTSTSFPTYPALIAAIHAQLSTLAASDNPDHLDTLSTILCSHPRLGEKHVDSEQSRAEQAQLHTGHNHDEAQLNALNTEYEQKFPGLRYVY